LSCQSITSQTSITFLFILNYEFLLVFRFVFAILFIPLQFPFLTISDLIPFSMIKCGYKNRGGVFRSVFIPRCGVHIREKKKKSLVLLSQISSSVAGAVGLDTAASRLFCSVIMIVQNDARIQSPDLSDCSVKPIPLRPPSVARQQPSLPTGG
jgi:hypothetical protein